GPTGAGKSTIIDAVVFALYGRVAGAETSEDRMRSDFAPAELEPFVELDFSTSSGIYRIRRTPRYERPKVRGTGTTTANATARLWRMVSPGAGPDGEPVANRIEEVGSEVARIVGLTRDQFVQTVVLPQGEFASFLRADAETRRALLQRLFGTEVYDRVVRHLEERRKAARQARRDADAQVAGAVRAFSGAAGVDEDGEAALAGLLDADDDLLTSMQQHVSALEHDVLAATDHRTAAEDSATRAAQLLMATQAHEERRLRKVALVAEQTRLDAEEPEHQVRAARLAEASRAARVRPLLVGIEQASRRHDDAAARLIQARTRLPDGLASRPEGDWTGEGDRLRDLAGTLRPVATVEEKLSERAVAVSELRRTQEAVEQRRAEVDTDLAALPKRLDEIRAQGRAAATRAGTAGTAAEALRAARERLQAARSRADLDGKVAQARARRLAAHEAARAAQTAEEQLRRAYLDAIAGHLSVELVDGEPCPVCGATTHPRPAGRAPDAVAREDVERAADHRAGAQRTLESVADELTALSEQLAVAAAVAGDLTVDEAAVGVAAAESAQAAADQARAEYEQLRAAEQAAETELERLRLTSKELDLAVTTGTAALTRAVEDLATERTTVEAARQGFSSVAERVAALVDQADAAAAAHRCADDVADAARDVAARTAELEAAAVAEGFADGEAAAEAQLPASDVAELEAAVEKFDQQRSSTRALLAAPELAPVATDDVREITPLADTADSARLALETAQSRLAGHRQRLADAQRRLADVVSVLNRRREVGGATSAVIRIADLVAASVADNARSMTLPTFVLLERFGDVVSAANGRLSVMSDGRFSLEHTDDRQGGRRSGLGLLVRDTHTDQPRDPRTLSGGETFYCSLALALGLADVVTAEAGGIDLGTLFVDEGFGTLDPDTL
ncbi:MAG TPA: SMC family ATPase, partial [Actinomycetes bacterium]|nr:SMC family ATPase [Actinomycetes bacterium]